MARVLPKKKLRTKNPTHLPLPAAHCIQFVDRWSGITIYAATACHRNDRVFLSFFSQIHFHWTFEVGIWYGIRSQYSVKFLSLNKSNAYNFICDSTVAAGSSEKKHPPQPRTSGERNLPNKWFIHAVVQKWFIYHSRCMFIRQARAHELRPVHAIKINALQLSVCVRVISVKTCTPNSIFPVRGADHLEADASMHDLPGFRFLCLRTHCLHIRLTCSGQCGPHTQNICRIDKWSFYCAFTL